MGAENLNILQAQGKIQGEGESPELVFTPESMKEIKPERKPNRLSLVSEHNDLLREIMPEYDFSSEPYETRKNFIDDMIYTMRSVGGIGLSACQVGARVRVFVMDRVNLKTGQRIADSLICFNPKILEASDILSPMREGCLTFTGLALQIKRPKMIKVQFFDEEENEIVLELDGMDAKVFQHELDHMNGVLFTTKVDPKILDWEREKQRKLLKKYTKFYKNIA